MTTGSHRYWLHLFAVSTVMVAMLALVAGALVTTRNAGMAFRDWPTSDGHGMLTYPWLADFSRDGDKFLEHGHRLAGLLIGLWSIGLAAAVVTLEPRRWVKLAAGAVLAGVICQGILGGFRVWFDERGLAMLHGVFAACVLSLMGVVATALSDGWCRAKEVPLKGRLNGASILSMTTVAVLGLQYLLGGLVRHRGTGLHEHLGLGILSLLVVAANAIAAQRSGAVWLRRSGWLLLAIVLFQVGLGGAAWVTKFGFATAGYVATADSIQQIVFRTVHTVVGILVLMTASVHAARVQRMVWVNRTRPYPVTADLMSRAAPVKGGIA